MKKKKKQHTHFIASHLPSSLAISFCWKEKAPRRPPASSPSPRLYLLVPGVQVQELLPAGHVNHALQVRGRLLKQLGQAPRRPALGARDGLHITGVVPRAQLSAAVARGGPRGQEWRGHVSARSSLSVGSQARLGGPGRPVRVRSPRWRRTPAHFLRAPAPHSASFPFSRGAFGAGSATLISSPLQTPSPPASPD